MKTSNAVPKSACYEIYCLNYSSEEYLVYRNNSVAYTGDLDSCIDYVQAAKSGAPQGKPSLAIELLYGLFVTPSIVMLLTWFVYYVTEIPEGFRAGLVNYLITAGAVALFKALVGHSD